MTVAMAMAMTVAVVVGLGTVVDPGGDILALGEDVHLLPDQLDGHGHHDCPDVSPDVQYDGTLAGVRVLWGIRESFLAHGLVSSDVVVGDCVWKPPPGCAMNGNSLRSFWFLLDVPSIKALAAPSGS